MMPSKKIDVKEQAVLVLVSLKTQELVQAVEEQANALHELMHSLQDYNDWLEEQLVRMDGEK